LQLLGDCGNQRNSLGGTVPLRYAYTYRLARLFPSLNIGHQMWATL
jgi:hypothetical protein